MPIPPRPITFECPHCHWRKSYAPSSDALCLPPWAKHCPQCGHKGMQSKSANALDGLLARLFPFSG